MKKLISSGFWVIGVNLFRQGFSLLFIMVLVRQASQAEVGQFQLIVAAVAFCGLFALPGMSNVITQSVARGHPGTFHKCSLYAFLGSIAGGLALILFGLTHQANDQESLRNGLLVAGGLFPFAHGLTGWAAYQAGLSQFKRNALWQGMGHTLSYGGMIAALLLADATIVWLVAISLAVLGIVNVGATAFVLLRVPHARPEPGGVSYGLKTSVYGAANTAGNHIDKFLLFYFLSPESLAVFVVAERIPEILKKYIQSVRIVLIPSFSKKTVYTRSLNRKINIFSFAISITIVLIIFAIIPWLLPLAFTQDYSDSVLYCQLLLGTLILGQSAQTKITYIISRFDAVGSRNVILGSNLVRIIASLILVPLFGIFGAVGSTALYRLSTAAFVWYHLRRHHFGGDVPGSAVSRKE